MVPLSPVYLVPLGLLVFGSPFVTIGIVYQRKNSTIRSWPRVKGRMVSATLGTAYSVDARFTYEVDGQTYEGSKISREGIGGDREKLQAWIHRHSPGTEVSVYVDPHDAAKAYLEWARSVGSIILLVWGGLYVFAGLLVLVIFMLVGS
jgi:hypothetical protein